MTTTNYILAWVAIFLSLMALTASAYDFIQIQSLITQ